MEENKERNYMLSTHIEAFDINDAWFQCIVAAVNTGHKYLITRGSFEGQQRSELDFVTVNIQKPGHRPLNILIPEGSSLPAPNDMDSIEKYFVNYLMSGQKNLKGEDYTYTERLVNPKSLEGEKIVKIQRIRKEYDEEKDENKKNALLEEIVKAHSTAQTIGVNQIEELIKMYKKSGQGTNQATMEIGMPSDVLWDDPPCCRLIDTRIRYGKLHFFVYFRSWDLIGGFPTNLAGLQMLKEYMGGELGVEDGNMFAISKGLHVYEHQWDYAKLRIGKQKDNSL
jgi:thymidylate synthase